MTASEQAVTEEQMGETILEIRNVSVTFGMDRGKSRVLNDVSLDIHRGEILGIVGESGSGKSMFASALLDAVVEPGQLTGSITYSPKKGENIDLFELNKRELRKFRWEEIAMVFQGAMSSFNPTTDIRTHFEETIQVHDVELEAGMARAYELLRDLYLDPERVLTAHPHELSGGMRQRALIALSLVLEPDVLVMDEPTSALDLLMQRSILKMFRELHAKYDLTLVFITHDLPLVAQLADRLSMMYAFEFIEMGPTPDILENAAHPYTRALLNATPNLSGPVEEMQPIAGSSPDPVNVPSGCSYHPRCSLATEKCEKSDPDEYTVSDDQQVTCHHWEKAMKEIPLNTQANSAGSSDE